ncbi:phosphopantetheine-binding protein [Longispora fulva]|uniref:Acyl carrier protein n=1 Tax=Longispora fulva TaxID=619741 RepID=A0A8J7KSN4_9ACTN|nr:phosphopantetheine-binding protein [Longispora fulva]MBG6139827.1 acyl carrier protein [Longispora fulva]
MTDDNRAADLPDVETGIRAALAEVLDLDPAHVADLPADTALFDGGLGLGSLNGVRLLELVKARFGVDVAADDWALESLRSIGTLCAFVRAAVV